MNELSIMLLVLGLFLTVMSIIDYAHDNEDVLTYVGLLISYIIVTLALIMH